MNKLWLIYILLLTFTVFSCDNVEISEKQEETFIKFYGNPVNNYKGKDVIQTLDGGYAILGVYQDLALNNYNRIFFVLTNNKGNIIGPYHTYDTDFNIEPNSMIQDSDGSFYIVGSQTIGTGSTAEKDIYILKLDSQGNRVWSEIYNSDDTKVDGKYEQQRDGKNQEGYTLIFDSDTAIIAGGYTTDNGNSKNGFFIMVGKNDSTLYKLYAQNLNGNQVVKKILNPHNIYFTIGSTEYRTPIQSIEIVAKKSLLIFPNTKPESISGDGVSIGNHLVELTNKNHFAFVGTETINENLSKAIIGFVEYDEIEATLSTPTWSYIGKTGLNTGKYVVSDDKGVYFFGEMDVSYPSGNNSTSIYMRKTDFNGTEIFTQTYGEEDLDQQVAAVKKTNDGFVMVGTNGSVIMLIKTDELGDL